MARVWATLRRSGCCRFVVASGLPLPCCLAAAASIPAPYTCSITKYDFLMRRYSTEAEEDVRFFAGQGEDFWRSDESCRRFLAFFAKRFGIEKVEDFGKVRLTDVIASGGYGLAERCFHDMSEIVRLMYPDAHLWPWQLADPVPKHYWASMENQKAFLEWLGHTLGYKSREDWYRVKVSDFRRHRGATLLTLHYKSSPYQLLSTIYNDFSWKPWLFETAFRNFYDKRENREAYVKWLVEQVNVKSAAELKGHHYRSHHGGGLLLKYGSSPSRVLKSLEESGDTNGKKDLDYVEGNSSEENVNALSRGSYTPRKYWGSIDNQRRFIEEAATKLGHRPGDLTQWYQRRIKDLFPLGGRGLAFRYNDSLFHLLLSAYPDFDWQPWRFKKRPRKLLDDPDMVKKLVSFLEKELKIAQPQDWTRVSTENLRSLNLSKIFEEFPIAELLKKAYPDIAWSDKLGGKKANER